MEHHEYKLIEKNKNKYTFEVKTSFEEFESEREKALKRLSKNVKIPGFRPGKAPREKLEQEVGYKAYLEAVNHMLPHAALHVVEDENLNPISSFDYDLKDLEKDKGVVFTFSFVNQPEIDPEKFKSIKIEYKEPEIKDEEAVAVIKNIIKTSLPREKWEKNIIKTTDNRLQTREEKNEETGGTIQANGNGNDEGKNEKLKAVSQKLKAEEEDIEITDDLVAEIGYEDEKTFDGLLKKVTETLKNIKREQADNEFASKAITEAIKLSDFEVPADFVEREVGHRESHFRSRLNDLKLSEEMYLKTQGTSLEELKKEWEEQAKADVSADLLLINLAAKENLVPTEQDLEDEIEKTGDDSIKAKYKDPTNRDYLKTTLARNRGFKRLIEIVKGEGSSN